MFARAAEEITNIINAGFECEIVLDNATKAYYPGETVTGRIIIVNEKDRNVKGLKLKFSGTGAVQFAGNPRTTERRKRRNDNVQNTATQAEEVYLDYSLNVFGNDGGQTTIHPGRFEYPFQYPLPLSLPPSYDGSLGKITYQVEVDLPRSWVSDFKTTTVFRVLGYFDLSSNLEAQQEGIMTQERTFGNCCCSGGTASFVVKLQKRGVPLGEFIPFVVEIDNKSSKTFGTRISLIQKVMYHALDKKQKIEDVICSAEGPFIPPGEDYVWRGNVLQVPPNIIPGLGGVCKLIHVSYELKMELVGSRVFTRVTGKTPIIIGSIPARNPNQTIYELPPPYQAQATGALQQASPSAPMYYTGDTKETSGSAPPYDPLPPKAYY
ncbi:unnamed protein product [Allacma fusca]|uniref:Arrestin C-terminal-like domain-containing protein n=1 Tax=Allacma fusca TaxID=39272 RepID=A0A8J2PLB2_9HEXA|nr:unnamed protein product [Allacma fusca]